VANPASGGSFTGTGGRTGSGSGPNNSGGGPITGGGGGGGVDGSGGAAQGGNGDFEETGTLANCTFTINGAPAAEMPTVGVVDFQVTGLASAITAGVVQFGLTTDYSLSGPVDLQAASYKTLLLGMKKNSAYHYRIGVSTGSEYCYSDDQTLQTGGLRAGVNELTNKAVTGTVAPGFIVAAAKSTAAIYNKEGDLVWGYAFEAGSGAVGGIFSAKLSYDGKYMIARDLGPFDAGTGGQFFVVAIDGSGLTTFDAQGGDHHDFTVTPNGIAYIAKEAAGSVDQIFTVNLDGTNAKILADLKPFVDAFPQNGGFGEASHINVIHYWQERDEYTVSNRESDAIAVVSGSGEVLAGFGKPATGSPSFTTVVAEGAEGGAGAVWRVQHGHDIYAEDKFLVFSNNNMGSTSHALHYTITGNTAQLDWQYTAMGNSGTQGDIQMLPNGNVLITASNAGTIHEINSSQQLQASYSNGANGFGYVMHRPSLYGAPPQGR
jgi:hypothetical protein